MNWRGPTAAAVLAAGVAVWAHALVGGTPFVAVGPDDQPTAAFDRAMARLGADPAMPARGVVGYRDESAAFWAHGDEAAYTGSVYLMARYGLAPVVVDPKARGGVVVVNTRDRGWVVETPGAGP